MYIVNDACQKLQYEYSATTKIIHNYSIKAENSSSSSPPWYLKGVGGMDPKLGFVQLPLPNTNPPSLSRLETVNVEALVEFWRVTKIRINLRLL